MWNNQGSSSAADHRNLTGFTFWGLPTFFILLWIFFFLGCRVSLSPTFPCSLRPTIPPHLLHLPVRWRLSPLYGWIVELGGGAALVVISQRGWEVAVRTRTSSGRRRRRWRRMAVALDEVWGRVKNVCKQNGLLILSVLAVVIGCLLGFFLRGKQLSEQVSRLKHLFLVVTPGPSAPHTTHPATHLPYLLPQVHPPPISVWDEFPDKSEFWDHTIPLTAVFTSSSFTHTLAICNA